MSEQDKNYPQMQEMIKNFAKFSKDVAMNPNWVSLEEYSQRMNTCRACDYFDAQQVRCRKCGCMLRGKAKFKAGKCPLKKW